MHASRDQGHVSESPVLLSSTGCFQSTSSATYTRTYTLEDSSQGRYFMPVELAWHSWETSVGTPGAKAQGCRARGGDTFQIGLPGAIWGPCTGYAGAGAGAIME